MNAMRAQDPPTTSNAAEATDAGRQATSAVVAEAVVAEVADRLTDPDQVSALWEEDELFDVYPVFGRIPLAPAYSLIEGIAGTAVLFAEISRRDPQGQRRAHAHLSAAVQRMPPHRPRRAGPVGRAAVDCCRSADHGNSPAPLPQDARQPRRPYPA